MMKMRMVFVCALALLFSTSAWAQSVVIDNFNTGAGGASFDLTSNAGSPSNFQLDTGLTTTLGGNRIERSHFVSGGGPGDNVGVDNTALPGVFQANLTASAVGHFHLYYGYTAYDTSTSDPVAITHTFADINADVASALPPGSINAALDFLTLDHPITLVFKIVTNHGGGANQAVSVVSKPVAASLSSFTVTFTEADMVAGLQPGSGALNFNDVDQVILEPLDMPGGTDLEFDNFRFVSVPEPATVALLLGSVVLVGGGIWYRRRKAANYPNIEVI